MANWAKRLGTATAWTVSIMVAVTCCSKPDIIQIRPYSLIPCSEVVEFLPAPGQFVGEGYDADTMKEACAYAYGRISEGKYVSLGAFGGYIVCKLESPCSWDRGHVIVVGNATEQSSEPGIIYVMEDINCNGLPDEEWYAIKGSLAGTDEETVGYSVTYYRSEKSDIRWSDSEGGEGAVAYNSYHTQESYYPAWVEEDSYTLSGIRLVSRAYDASGSGALWINPSYGHGYADNWCGKESELISRVNSCLDASQALPSTAEAVRISDAIDSEGNPAPISRVDFVKIQSAVQQVCGSIGEVSTEVCGVYGLESNFIE